MDISDLLQESPVPLGGEQQEHYGAEHQSLKEMTDFLQDSVLPDEPRNCQVRRACLL